MAEYQTPVKMTRSAGECGYIGNKRGSPSASMELLYRQASCSDISTTGLELEHELLDDIPGKIAMSTPKKRRVDSILPPTGNGKSNSPFYLSRKLEYSLKNLPQDPKGYSVTPDRFDREMSTPCSMTSSNCSENGMILDSTLDASSPLDTPCDSPMNSLPRNKKDLKKHLKKDELWPCIESDYQYLMDEEIIKTCQTTESDLSWDDDDMCNIPKVSFTEFIQQYEELTDWLAQIQRLASRTETTRSETYLRQSYHEEVLHSSPRRKLFNDYAKQLLKRYPSLKEEITVRLEKFNDQWQTLVQTIAPKFDSGDTDTMLRDLEHDLNNLRRWLREVEQRLLPLCIKPHWTRRDLEACLIEHLVLQKDIESQSKAISAVLKLSDRLQAEDIHETNHENPASLFVSVVNLERSWHAVWLQSVEWQCRLEDAIEHEKCLVKGKHAPGSSPELHDSYEDDSDFFHHVKDNSSTNWSHEAVGWDSDSSCDIIPFPADEYEKIILTSDVENHDVGVPDDGVFLFDEVTDIAYDKHMPECLISSPPAFSGTCEQPASPISTSTPITVPSCDPPSDIKSEMRDRFEDTSFMAFSTSAIKRGKSESRDVGYASEGLSNDEGHILSINSGSKKQVKSPSLSHLFDSGLDQSLGTNYTNSIREKRRPASLPLDGLCFGKTFGNLLLSSSGKDSILRQSITSAYDTGGSNCCSDGEPISEGGSSSMTQERVEQVLLSPTSQLYKLTAVETDISTDEHLSSSDNRHKYFNNRLSGIVVDKRSRSESADHAIKSKCKSSPCKSKSYVNGDISCGEASGEETNDESESLDEFSTASEHEHVSNSIVFCSTTTLKNRVNSSARTLNEQNHGLTESMSPFIQRRKERKLRRRRPLSMDVADLQSGSCKDAGAEKSVSSLSESAISSSKCTISHPWSNDLITSSSARTAGNSSGSEGGLISSMRHIKVHSSSSGSSSETDSASYVTPKQSPCDSDSDSHNTSSTTYHWDTYQSPLYPTNSDAASEEPLQWEPQLELEDDFVLGWGAGKPNRRHRDAALPVRTVEKRVKVHRNSIHHQDDDSDSDLEDLQYVIDQSEHQIKVTQKSLYKRRNDSLGTGISLRPAKYMEHLLTCQTNLNCLVEVDKHLGDALPEEHTKIHELVGKWETLHKIGLLKHEQSQKLCAIHGELSQITQTLKEVTSHASASCVYNSLKDLSSSLIQMEDQRRKVLSVQKKLAMLSREARQFKSSYPDISLVKVNARMTDLHFQCKSLHSRLRSGYDELDKKQQPWTDFIHASQELSRQFDKHDSRLSYLFKNPANLETPDGIRQCVQTLKRVHLDITQREVDVNNLVDLIDDLRPLVTPNAQNEMTAKVAVLTTTLVSLKRRCDRMMYDTMDHVTRSSLRANQHQQRRREVKWPELTRIMRGVLRGATPFVLAATIFYVSTSDTFSSLLSNCGISIDPELRWVNGMPPS